MIFLNHVMKYVHGTSSMRHQGTVPAAIRAFIDGEDFEDCIRIAVSLGGDADTLGCITSSIAEAYYGVPRDLIEDCRKRLTPEILEVVDGFYDCINKKSGA